MRRREFIVAIGTMASWALAVRAQQPMPVVGFVNAASRQGYARLSAFHRTKRRLFL
jgi:hypothetical protein